MADLINEVINQRDPYQSQTVATMRGRARPPMRRPQTPLLAPGQVAPGNINLNARPIVPNADGTISTVRSIGINEGGRHFLIPTVDQDGSGVLSNADAIAQYRRTGFDLGEFSSDRAADAYGRGLHDDQASAYADRTAGPEATARDEAAGAMALPRTIRPGYTPTQQLVSDATEFTGLPQLARGIGHIREAASLPTIDPRGTAAIGDAIGEIAPLGLAFIPMGEELGAGLPRMRAASAHIPGQFPDGFLPFQGVPTGARPRTPFRSTAATSADLSEAALSRRAQAPDAGQSAEGRFRAENAGSDAANFNRDPESLDARLGLPEAPGQYASTGWATGVTQGNENALYVWAHDVAGTRGRNPLDGPFDNIDDAQRAASQIRAQGRFEHITVGRPNPVAPDGGRAAGGRFTLMPGGSAAERNYQIPTAEGDVTLNIKRGADGRHTVEWSRDQRRPAGQRVAAGLSSIRGVRDALLHDAQTFSPQGYTMRAITPAHARLYDALAAKLTAEAGYSPTIATRMRRALSEALPNLVESGAVERLPLQGEDLENFAWQRDFNRNLIRPTRPTQTPPTQGQAAGGAGHAPASDPALPRRRSAPPLPRKP